MKNPPADPIKHLGKLEFLRSFEKLNFGPE